MTLQLSMQVAIFQISTKLFLLFHLLIKILKEGLGPFNCTTNLDQLQIQQVVWVNFRLRDKLLKEEVEFGRDLVNKPYNRLELMFRS